MRRLATALKKAAPAAAPVHTATVWGVVLRSTGRLVYVNTDRAIARGLCRRGEMSVKKATLSW